MKVALTLLIAPLLSSFFMMAGSSLLTTITSLRLNSIGFEDVMIALVASSYYTGMMLGSFKVEHLIARVGHGRAFSVFISLLSFSAMVPPLLDSQIMWMAARMCSGFALAGLYVVLESWILSVSTDKYRGRFLALYIIALSFGAIAGQQFLNVADSKSLIPFCLVCLALSISTLPFSLSKVKPPIVHKVSEMSLMAVFRYSPVGFYGCVLSGILVSSMFSMYPVVFQDANFSMFQISQIVAMLNMGGFLLNYPFGWLCDHKDRLLVMMGLVFMGLLGAIYLCFGSLDFSFGLLASAFIFGGGSIILYTVAMGIACHSVSQENMTKTAQVLVFAYCLGGLLGPILGSIAMKIENTRGIFYMDLLCLGIFLGYLIKGYKKQEQPNLESITEAA